MGMRVAAAGAVMALSAGLFTRTTGGADAPAPVAAPSPRPAVSTATTTRPAESHAPALFDPARHMRVSEVRAGMKGYGLSVFKGTKIERFDVEVLSVLKNFNPKYDVVLITCTGANLEHTGSIAGMSGSPVFLKDDAGRERMIGAFAYGWPMTKDPLAGVQPIEYMLTLPTEAAKPRPPGGRRHGRWRRRRVGASSAHPSPGRGESRGEGRDAGGLVVERRGRPVGEVEPAGGRGRRDPAGRAFDGTGRRPPAPAAGDAADDFGAVGATCWNNSAPRSRPGAGAAPGGRRGVGRPSKSRSPGSSRGRSWPFRSSPATSR